MLLTRILLGLLALLLLIATGMAASNPQLQFVFLWTDILVYILVAGIVSYILYARKKEHLRAPWRHVLRRRLAMNALVVLMAYIVIGLADSVHFRMALEKQAEQEAQHFSGDVLSALDVVLTTLKEQQERTYSAPFATHSYMMENIETDAGQVRDYPRLKFGGAHLANPAQEKLSDISLSMLLVVIEALAITAVLVLIVVYDLSRKQQQAMGAIGKAILRGAMDVPWREMIAAAFFVVLLACFVANLGKDYHVLGTDKVGQDVLYLAIKSIRTGLVIGTLTTLMMLPFAVLFGIMAGHFRGWVDDVIQYLYTTLNSIPGVLLIAAAVLTLQVYMDQNQDMFETITERADIRLLFLCLILGITSWTGLCRLLRGETLKLTEMDYIQAANAFGVGNMKIITRHIMPNVMHIVLIAIVLDFSGLVLAEAVLSYVGVGVDPIMISWGNMINSARLEMAREPIVWWSLVAAFFFMFMLVLAANLFSDAVRDAFDPRITRSV